VTAKVVPTVPTASRELAPTAIAMRLKELILSMLVLQLAAGLDTRSPARVGEGQGVRAG
jgi:hypothetical protein